MHWTRDDPAAKRHHMTSSLFAFLFQASSPGPSHKRLACTRPHKHIFGDTKREVFEMTHAIRGFRGSRLIGAIVISVLCAVVVAAAPGAFAGNDDEQWVGTWGTALHEPNLLVPGLANGGFNNQTLRQIVHTSVGGRQVRVRLSTFA